MSSLLILAIPLVFGPIGMGLVLIGPVLESAQNDSESGLRLIMRTVGLFLLFLAACCLLAGVADLIVNILMAGRDEIWRVILLGVFALFSGVGGGLVMAISSQLGGRRTQGGQDALRALVIVAAVIGWGCLIACGWILFLFPMIILVTRLAYDNRVARRTQLLWSLSLAVDQKLPLAEEIRRFEATTSGLTNTKTRRLRMLIEDGHLLSDALVSVPGLLSSESVTLIRVGEASGNLAGALRAASASYTTRNRSSVNNGDMFWMFLGYVLIIMVMVVGFVMYSIIPKFKKIFYNFGTELPPITNTLIAASDLVALYWYLVPLVLIVICAWFLAFYLAGWDLAIGPLKTIPIRRQTPTLFRSLALIIEAGKPLSEGLNSLIRSTYSKGVRQCLGRVADAVNQGEDFCTALRGAGLMKRGEVVLAQSAQRAGNLAWALREMASSQERRAQHRWQMFLELIQPPAILIVGAIAAFVVVGIFMPLVKLLNDLS